MLERIRNFLGLTVPKPIPYVSSRTKVATLPDGSLTLWDDGTASAKVFDDYLKTYTGKGHIISNFVFNNVAQVFNIPLSKVETDNIAYNNSNVHGPATVGVFSGKVTDMLQAYSAVLVNGKFDPKSVKAIPDALASPRSTDDIPAILEGWKVASFFPLMLDATQAFA